MFEKLREFAQGGRKSLLVGTEGKPTEDDLIVATGILLLEAAGSDQDYAPEETKIIFSVLGSQFKLSEARTLELLEISDSLRADQEKIDAFVEALNAHFTPEQRQQILTMIWRVILADGRVDHHEEKYAHQLRVRLQLSEEHARNARAKAGK